MNKIDDYYDILALLGRVSGLVEINYDSFSTSQLRSIRSYFETIVFHISNNGDRVRILFELEAASKYVGDCLKDM